MRNSISLRFNLLTSLAVTILLVLFGAYNHSKTEESLRASLDKQTDAVMGRLALSLPAALWNYEQEQLIGLIESEVSSNEVKGGFIIDNDGKMVLGRMSNESGEIVEAELPSMESATKESRLTFDDSGTINAVGQLIIIVDSSSIDDLLSKSMTRTLVQLTLMVLLLVAMVTFLLQRIVINPLNEVGSALNDISHGEGDLTRRLSVKREDEIGTVANHFNSFADKIQTLVQQVVSSTSQISLSVQELIDVAHTTNTGAQTQRSETEQAAAAAYQMSATASDISKNATQAAEAAQLADNESMNAKGIVANTLTSIDQLAREIEESVTAIHELESNVDSITAMVAVIQSIAGQTNLLALNAAIEAARAGDKGRGFAVVADEVRSLANKTQVTTEEIQQIINQLQSGAKNAVAVISNNKKSSVHTVQEVNNTDSSLNDIVTSVSTISDINILIASASEQQTAVTEEVSKSITRITEVADNTAQGAMNTEETCTQLSNLVRQIEQQLGQFKI
ncbi:methyl-accepting chemotaxis protein [Neptunomonas sp.]|uniref:methyl-accepting chemotaxis protein n=1 Tax=Neptunomonas sp. TaxID=1971898 RepID=UPI0025CFD0F4|nr:methyl-accepting chemotaxis protein [Neptunomonas sp.]